MAVDIAVGNVVAYTNVKSWIGAGRCGIVFGTYSDASESIAVKMVRIPRNDKDP